MLLAIGLLSFNSPPILQQKIRTENFGEMAISTPLWGVKALALVFVDTKKFPAVDLGRRLAAIGVTAAVIDAAQFFQGINVKPAQCLAADQVATAINTLLKGLPTASANKVMIAGIAEGALIPFLNAQTLSKNTASNLSIGFSAILADGLVLCPPFLIQHQNRISTLTSSPSPLSNWRSVWTDYPPEETALFIRTLGNADTRIAAYDTPLDSLLAEELKTSIGQADRSSPPMPVVEVPSAKSGDTVTLFYSGDGGWRDLDRTVAGEMAALNYPVVGVDVLRYFWERKTPEQAAADLAATMAYYRKHWGMKSFVLAGYSFGADILPAVYNRLPQQDRDSVVLLVLLAPAKQADFEIHASGWLGHSAGEQPLAPELVPIAKAKIFCIYGKEEENETACTDLQNSGADILGLPGGHHFDQDYPKLTRRILDVYRQHGIK